MNLVNLCGQDVQCFHADKGSINTVYNSDIPVHH